MTKASPKKVEVKTEDVVKTPDTEKVLKTPKFVKTCANCEGAALITTNRERGVQELCPSCNGTGLEVNG